MGRLLNPLSPESPVGPLQASKNTVKTQRMGIGSEAHRANGEVPRPLHSLRVFVKTFPGHYSIEERQIKGGFGILSLFMKGNAMRAETASEKLHLVYATDKGYLFLATASAKSAICKVSQPERLVVHLLDCGLTDEDWATFEATLHKGAEAVEVCRHQVSTERFGGFIPWKGSFAAYARLYLAELLPEDNWCLYADCDTIFLDDPLKLLAECDPAVALKGYWIWYDKPCKQWVREPVESWLVEHCPGMDFSQYLNSGFLLMNLEWWREHRLLETCFDFFNRFPKVPWPDEMALNVVCHDHLAGLPEGWGAFPDYAFTLPRARSIHYVCNVLNAPKFKRFWGYDDATAVWVNFVRAVLGVPVRRACGVPGWKWTVGRAYNHLFRVLIWLLRHLPILSHWRRLDNVAALFATGENRKALSLTFWSTP